MNDNSAASPVPLELRVRRYGDGNFEPKVNKPIPLQSAVANLPAGDGMETAQELRRIANCIARLAALDGGEALAIGTAERRAINLRVEQIKNLTLEILSTAKLDGAQLGLATAADAHALPSWSSDLRHLDGARVTAIEHFDRYWKAPIQEGHFDGGDLRRADPALYKAIAAFQIRRGKAISDLFASPHRSEAAIAAQVVQRSRKRLAKAEQT